MKILTGLIGLLVVFLPILIIESASRCHRFTKQRRRQVRAKQVETIATNLDCHYEAKPRLTGSHHTHYQADILNGVGFLIQNHEALIYDLVQGKQTTTYLRLRLPHRFIPSFSIAQRMWVDQAGLGKLVSEKYTVTGRPKAVLPQFFDALAFATLDACNLIASSDGSSITLRLAELDAAQTKEQYLDMIEAAYVMLDMVNNYHQRATQVVQPVRLPEQATAGVALSTYWGRNRRVNTSHRTLSVCPMWLVSSNESNTQG